MTSATPAILPVRSLHLDRFLHATVGLEHGGMDLSVLSMLARLDRDPWAEAARLASLPRAAAAASLADAIASLPMSAWPPAEAGAIAQRLVPLLPTEAEPVSGDTPADVLLRARMMTAMLIGGVLGAALTFQLLVINAQPWPASHMDQRSALNDAPNLITPVGLQAH